MKLALTHKSYCRGILFHILYLFNYIVIVLEQAGILVSPRSQSARDPSQTKISVSPRSQSTQDPSQPKIPVSPGCPHAYLAHVYLVFGSCLFDIWLMPTGGPPRTQKSLTQFPLPRFLAYVRASGGFSC